MKNDILRKVATYATGRETLRCLALATVDAPAPAESFNLVDPAKFKEYEVSSVLFSTSRLVTTSLLGVCSYNGSTGVFKNHQGRALDALSFTPCFLCVSINLYCLCYFGMIQAMIRL